MSAVSIKLHKEISSDEAQTTWFLTMYVVSVVNVTPRIFVVQYTPPNRYSGPATHTFSNVAYLDELQDVQDEITNSRKPCLYRCDRFTHRFSTLEDCTEFVSKVERSASRLVSQLENMLTTEYVTDILITADGVTEVVCTEHIKNNTDTTVDEYYEDSIEQQDSDLEVLSINDNGD